MAPTLNLIYETLFRKRSFVAEQSLESPLRRCLSTFDLTFFTISNMCGSGLFVLSGSVIRDHAGPAAAISYLIGAISSIFTALCYIELMTLIPKAGSSYTYTYIFIGEFPAFCIGWLLISDDVMGMAVVAKAFSGTVNALSGGAILNYTITHVIMFHSTYLDVTIDLVAFLFILVLTAVIMTGAKSSLTLNTIITWIQLMILFILAVASFTLGRSTNWTHDGGYFPYGASGVIRGAGITVFAFIGFEFLASASEEAKNPRRSIPRALLITLSFITFVYVFAIMSLTYLVPWRLVDYSAPFVTAFEYVNQPVLKWLAAIATLLATSATKISAMFTVPRILYAIASDGLLFECMAWVWPVTQVPLGSILCGGLLVAILAMFFPIQSLAELATFGILICFIAMGVNVILLKYDPKYYSQIDTAQEVNSRPLNVVHTELVDASVRSRTGKEDVSILEMTEPEVETVKLRNFLTSPTLNIMRSISFFHTLLVIHVILTLLLGLLITILENMFTSVTLGMVALLTLITFIMLCCYQPYSSSSWDCFQTPFMPFTPCISMLINSVLLMQLPTAAWIRGLIFTGIGVVIYLFYGVFHSKLRSSSGQVPLLKNIEKESLSE